MEELYEHVIIGIKRIKIRQNSKQDYNNINENKILYTNKIIIIEEIR